MKSMRRATSRRKVRNITREILQCGGASNTVPRRSSAPPRRRWKRTGLPEPEQGERLIRRLALTERVGGRAAAPVQLVDMRDELQSGNRSMFSRSLREAIQARLERKEQMMLLLNRRGYSTFVMCRSCGYVCAVSAL